MREYLVIDPLEHYAVRFRRDDRGRFGEGAVIAAQEALALATLEGSPSLCGSSSTCPRRGNLSRRGRWADSPVQIHAQAVSDGLHDLGGGIEVIALDGP